MVIKNMSGDVETLDCMKTFIDADSPEAAEAACRKCYGEPVSLDEYPEA